MAKVELSVAERLKQLYELQLIDSELDEIQIMKGELPMEVSDLEDEIVGLNTRVEKLENELKEIDSEISKHELNIKECDALIVKYTKQLDNVKNNREFDALTKEVEYQRLEIQLNEKKIKKINEGIAAKKEILEVSQKRKEVKAKDLDNKKVELEKIIEKTEKDEDRLVKKSEKARKNVDSRFLGSYDKIRTSYRNGLAVVPVIRQSCGGCFNAIPPQLQLEIGLHKKVVACEHCGRILIDDSVKGDFEQPGAMS